MRDLIGAGSDRWQRLLAIALLLLALVRMASVVMAEPMVGFANQFDMYRTAACVGLWPDDVPMSQATPEAPRDALGLFAVRMEDCYPSTQVGVAWLARGLDAVVDDLLGTDPDHLSMRMVGGVSLLLWSLCAALMTWMLWSLPRLLLAHGVASALLVADPINTLYLNTLYTEFPALLSTYCGVAILASLWSSPECSMRRLVAFSICLLLLGMSRVQHVALPLVLAVLASLALWRARSLSLPKVLLLASSCAVVFTLQLRHQGQSESIARANISNTVLGAAMPAGDPERIATALRLAPACAELAYSTWYRQHGVDVFAVCPELEQVSRLHLLGVSLAEPSIFARMLLRGVLLAQNLRLGYLGERGDANYASIGSDDSLFWASIATPINTVPPFAVLFLAIAICAGIPAFWIVIAWRRRAGVLDLASDSVVIAACVHVFALTLLSSVFGDGYSEVGRHLHLGSNALIAACALLPFWLWRRRRWVFSKPLPADIAATLCAIGWCLVCGIAVARLPLAVAAFRSLPIELPASGWVELEGWVLDARKPLQVSARIDDAPPIVLSASASPRLQRMYPYLAGSDFAIYRGSIDAVLLKQGRFLRIVAVDASGHETVVERFHIR